MTEISYLRGRFPSMAGLSGWRKVGVNMSITCTVDPIRVTCHLTGMNFYSIRIVDGEVVGRSLQRRCDFAMGKEESVLI